MKFPYVQRSQHDKEVEQLRERLVKAKQLADSARKSLEKEKGQVKRLKEERDQERSLRMELERLAESQALELKTWHEEGTPSAKSADLPQHLPAAWRTEQVHVQIEQTWSDDQFLGMSGFILVKDGTPQEVRLTCRGVAPERIDWSDRPDVYTHDVFADHYAHHVRCGFMACFRSRARHSLAIALPDASPATFRFQAAGFAPVPMTGLSGMSLPEFIQKVNRECRSVLEIGSRLVSPENPGTRALFEPHVKYTGFDFYKDANTDVVGDAHQLSSYFPEGTKFDAIFSCVVLEHVATPWKVAMEISKLLPIGGLVYHNAPFAWPLHETPWDFWRFSHEGLRSLFPPALGFEVLSLGLDTPCRIHLENPPPVLAQMPFHPTWAGSNILARKVRDYSTDDFRWNASLDQMVAPGTAYPLPAVGQG